MNKNLSKCRGIGTVALKRNGNETTVEDEEGNCKPTGTLWVQEECEKGEEQFGNEKRIGKTKSERIIEKGKVQRGSNRKRQEETQKGKEKEGLGRIRLRGERNNANATRQIRIKKRIIKRQS